MIKIRISGFIIDLNVFHFIMVLIMVLSVIGIFNIVAFISLNVLILLFFYKGRIKDKFLYKLKPEIKDKTFVNINSVRIPEVILKNSNSDIKVSKKNISGNLDNEEYKNKLHMSYSWGMESIIIPKNLIDYNEKEGIDNRILKFMVTHEEGHSHFNFYFKCIKSILLPLILVTISFYVHHNTNFGFFEFFFIIFLSYKILSYLENLTTNIEEILADIYTFKKGTHIDVIKYSYSIKDPINLDINSIIGLLTNSYPEKGQRKIGILIMDKLV